MKKSNVWKKNDNNFGCGWIHQKNDVFFGGSFHQNQFVNKIFFTRSWSFAYLDLAILSAYILPIENAAEERSYDRFFVFSHTKNKFFSKTLKISAPNSFFPKNDKNLLFIGVLFQPVLLTFKWKVVPKKQEDWRPT